MVWRLGFISYFDYPLEQGLRQLRNPSADGKARYFDYPLEQGLRHSFIIKNNYRLNILIIH